MNMLILSCMMTPLAAFIMLLLFGHREPIIASISRIGSFAMGVAVFGLLAEWALEDFPRTELDWITLYQQDAYRFSLVFFFDHIGAAYLFCTWVIFSVIVKYCRYYLHREEGYRRFFLTIFGFVFGLNTLILSGGLDVFFAGWEIVGIASFLLIAFYRHRQQPIRNALRAYSIYRLCDIGLLLAALLVDLLFQENRHFSLFTEALNNNTPPGGHFALLGLSLLLILASMGKSAQFPFCFWIPRAMEGPTPSSAIFYGALSIHLGVFLLLRTEAIWGFDLTSRVIVFIIGAVTVLVASISEQTQSNIKGRIAYASITQVGFMFIELALGLGSFVLIHVLGNAFVRCYQLLVSPSIVSHLMRVEGEIDVALDLQNHRMSQSLPKTLRDPLPRTIRNTLHVLSLQEFNLELAVRRWLWDSFRTLGSKIARITPTASGLIIAITLSAGLAFYLETGHISTFLAITLILGMFACSLLGFTIKRYPRITWNYIGASNTLAGIAAGLVGDGSWGYVLLFLSGIIPFWIFGRLVIGWMDRTSPFLENPFMFRAMDERSPLAALLFFLCFLGMVGFPLWPSFIGQDLILYHVSSEHAWMAPLVTLSLVLNGISASGTYMRLCAGRPVEIRSVRETGH
jgi:NADH:ubiquinone oxidoreductase subunit 5 (subunit L)/multisubunit Na+/H+ antiporter MnhA subunit